MSCRVCGKPTESVCSNCKSVAYCGITCQKNDWPKHGPDCRRTVAAAATAGVAAISVASKKTAVAATTASATASAIATTESAIATTTTTTTATASAAPATAPAIVTTTTTTAAPAAATPGSPKDTVLQVWRSFCTKLSVAEPKEIEEFVASVGPDVFMATYPTPKPTPIVSFAKGTAKEIYDGIAKLLQTHKQADVSANRAKSLRAVSEVIAARRKITSVKEFSNIATAMLSASQMSRFNSVLAVIRTQASTGEIEWDTADGKPRTYREDYGDWTVTAPTQPERRDWCWDDIRTLAASSVVSPPTKDDLRVYSKTADGKQWQQCVSQKKGKSMQTTMTIVADVRAEFDADMFRSTAWTIAQAECAPGASDRTRNSIYLLVMYDDTAPNMWRWQSYIGKAVPGVRKRWFSKDVSSHFGQMRRIVADVADSRPPHGLLVDAALARSWNTRRNGRWLAWLFVLRSDVADPAAVEHQLINTYRTTNPLFGLNIKT